MGDVEGLLMVIEVVFRLGLEHGVHDPGEALGVIVQGLETVDDLPAGKVVVLPVHLVHGLRVLAHVGADQFPVCTVAAGFFPQIFRHLVVRIDDGPFHQIGVGDTVYLGIPVHFTIGDLLGIQHVQRYLEHAGGDHIFVAVIVVLFAGDRIIVSECDKAGTKAVFLKETVHHFVPGLVLEPFVVCALRAGSREQTQQNTERCPQAEQFFHHLHIISIPNKGKQIYFIILRHIFKRKIKE